MAISIARELPGGSRCPRGRSNAYAFQGESRLSTAQTKGNGNGNGGGNGNGKNR
jgi:hypothetical protein